MIDEIRFFAGAARLLKGRAGGDYLSGHTSYVRREPIGLVGEVVDAEMVLWRVLGCSNDYADRPDRWSTRAQRGPCGPCPVF